MSWNRDSHEILRSGLVDRDRVRELLRRKPEVFRNSLWLSLVAASL